MAEAGGPPAQSRFSRRAASGSNQLKGNFWIHGAILGRLRPGRPWTNMGASPPRVQTTSDLRSHASVVAGTDSCSAEYNSIYQASNSAQGTKRQKRMKVKVMALQTYVRAGI